GGGHIYLYENQEDAEDDKYHSNCALTVTFYPRIMGADTVDGVRTTTVDMANGNYAMNIYVYKNKSVYSPEKKVYLNGEELVASYEDDLEYLVALTFNDFVLVRGNPNGHINGFINVLEYR
ncbi:MAG: hypothetical protein J6Y43_04710, partial [Clostridia bacterium]|nr:hypothetical protein [Clostridia bacterium]